MIVGFMQKKTVFGRRLYACGSNAEVAKLQGVNVNLIRFISFLICGLFAGMAGVMATIDNQLYRAKENKKVAKL